jgi:shikimate kinase
MPIVLCGLPGSGKSYFARRFSNCKKCLYLDLDILIKEQFNMSPRQIYKKYGEETLRIYEGKILNLINAQDAVLALGGGTLTNEHSALEAKKLGPLIYLKIDNQVIFQRLLNRKPKPLYLNDIGNLITKRIPLYEKYADYTLQVDQLSTKEVLEAMEKIYG